jgi:hypothetical protein
MTAVACACWVVLLVAGATGTASAQTNADGFVGYEKQLTTTSDHGEPMISVGPHGTPLLVAFTGGCGVAVSHDRGASFDVRRSDPADPGPTPGAPAHQCSDSTTALGRGGVLYTGSGWWDTPGGFVDYYNMFVAHSTDGGASWSPPAFATGDRDVAQALLLGRNSGHSDRLFLTADNQTGALYASATDLTRFVRWVVASHDNGTSFGPMRAIDSNDYPQIQGQQAGDYIPAAANGQLAFTYTASAAPGATCPCGIFETSRDDGATWNRHPTPFPANWVAAEHSHRGHFAIMSGQGVTATPAYPGAIAVATTNDSGATWSKPVLIGEPAGQPKLQPWIAYSPKGVLGVGYKSLDSELISQPLFFFEIVSGTLSYSYDYWTAASFDNGRTFSTPLRVSNLHSSPGNGAGDDFTSVALDDRYLYAAWGDRRTSPLDATPGPLEAYLARVPLTAYSHPTSPSRRTRTTTAEAG